MKLTTKSAFYLSLLSFLSFSSFAAPKIKDKIDLVKGWNAIYVESTPDDPSCETIFAGYPAVKSVGVYRSDADAATAQYDANGAELDQVVADDADGDPGLTEIFITPANGATSEFYKLEAK